MEFQNPNIWFASHIKTAEEVKVFKLIMERISRASYTDYSYIDEFYYHNSSVKILPEVFETIVNAVGIEPSSFCNRSTNINSIYTPYFSSVIKYIKRTKREKEFEERFRYYGKPKLLGTLKDFIEFSKNHPEYLAEDQVVELNITPM